MSKKKKHHYIQEAFLKNFSLGEQIFAFDKTKNEIRKSNVHNVFEANDFYRIPIRSYWGSMGTEEKEKINSAIIDRFGKPFDELNEDDKNKAEEWIEDYFANEVEPRFTDIISELRKNIGNVILGRTNNPITEKIRYKLSTCLAFYYCRTKMFRTTLINGLSDLYKQIIAIEAQFQGLRIDSDELNVSFSKDEAKMQHLQLISKLMDDDRMIEAIFSRKWTIVLNTSNVPFVLSDNLLTIKLTQQTPEFYGVGIKTPGAEIYCPITPQIMLVLNDPIMFPKIVDGKIIIIKDDGQISDINSFLIKNCFEACAGPSGDYLLKITGAKKNYR